MNEIELLTKQTQDAYEWVNMLIEPIPYEKWDEIPELFDTSVSWQVGHLIMSYFFHSVATIIGPRAEIGQRIPLREYAGLFTMAPASNAVGKTNAQELHQQLQFIGQESIKIIKSLSLDDLVKDLERTQVPHPIAKTKFEALDWNVKHTMWHCGQLAMLKRIVDQRFDFGLGRKS